MKRALQSHLSKLFDRCGEKDSLRSSCKYSKEKWTFEEFTARAPLLIRLNKPNIYEKALTSILTHTIFCLYKKNKKKTISSPTSHIQIGIFGQFKTYVANQNALLDISQFLSYPTTKYVI